MFKGFSYALTLSKHPIKSHFDIHKKLY